MITPFSEPVRGGITTFVRNLSTELTKQGAHVLILSRQGTADAGVQVLHGDASTFAHQASLAARKFEPHAIHAHGHWYAVRAALDARGPDSKVVFSFHTRWATRGILRKRFLQRLVARCDHLTFPSQHLRDSTHLALPSDKVKVVYPGSELLSIDEEARNRLRAEFLLRKCTRSIGYVGQFHWREKARGFGFLLEALAEPSLGGVGLAVAGEGSFLDGMKKYADKLGVSRRVLFLGEVANPGFVYAGCDVYCHASLQEGMGLSVLEAMRLRCAIVGFRTPFMKEAITHDAEGLLADQSVDSLADMLSRVLSDSVLAKRLGERAEWKAQRFFNWIQVARNFLDLYGVDS